MYIHWFQLWWVCLLHSICLHFFLFYCWCLCRFESSWFELILLRAESSALSAMLLLLPSAVVEDSLWRHATRRVSQWRGSTEHSLSQSEPAVYLKVLSRGTFEIKQAVFKGSVSQTQLRLDSYHFYSSFWASFMCVYLFTTPNRLLKGVLLR